MIVDTEPTVLHRHTIPGIDIQILEFKAPCRSFSPSGIAIRKGPVFDAIVIFRKSLKEAAGQERITWFDEERPIDHDTGLGIDVEFQSFSGRF